MSAVGILSPSRILRAGAFAVAMLICGSGQAKTTGVGDDPALQTGPCYQALVDKNAANPTTAPNRELGSACEAEHGDVEKAWARVIRLWGSDSTDIPDYDSYRRADAPVEGGPPKWLAIAGLLLAYGVLGTPMRSAASLMGSAGRRSSGAAIDVVASLILRAAVAAVLIALFSLPYLAALGGVALTAWILATLRRVAPKSPPAIPEATPGALSRHLAEAINDAGGALAGLAALALFVQHDLILLAVGLALAVVVSAAPVIRARRVLRGSLFGMPAAAALLAAGIGELMIATAPFSGWVGTLAGVTIAAPVALAALTLAVSWRLGVFVKSPVGL